MDLAAAGQPFTRDDARAAGWTDGRVTAAVRRGALVRLHRGVLAAGVLSEDLLARARGLEPVLLEGFHVSHESAAALWGVDCSPPRLVPEPADEPLRITVPPGSRSRDRPGVLAREAPVPASDGALRDGVPVTSPARTALDLARGRPLPEAVVALDAFLAARLATVEELRVGLVGMRGWRGVRAARRALSLADGRAESPMESRLRLVLTRVGLPRPEPQHEVRDDGGRFVARVDLAYPPERVAVEYDGRESHLEPARFLADRHRHHDLVELGWLVLRFTAPDVLGDPEGVVRRVQRAVSARHHAGRAPR